MAQRVARAVMERESDMFAVNGGAGREDLMDGPDRVGDISFVTNAHHKAHV